jgi:hypothetical protein
MKAEVKNHGSVVQKEFFFYRLRNIPPFLSQNLLKDSILLISA